MSGFDKAWLAGFVLLVAFNMLIVAGVIWALNIIFSLQVPYWPAFVLLLFLNWIFRKGR